MTLYLYDSISMTLYDYMTAWLYDYMPLVTVRLASYSHIVIPILQSYIWSSHTYQSYRTATSLSYAHLCWVHMTLWLYDCMTHASMCHLIMSHISSGSWHTHPRTDMTHASMCHMIALRFVSRIHVHQRDLSHLWASHVSHIEWVMSHTSSESCHTHPRTDMTHVSLCICECLNERVMSHVAVQYVIWLKMCEALHF